VLFVLLGAMEVAFEQSDAAVNTQCSVMGLGLVLGRFQQEPT
jgi:hypothetical protein